jgi:hypothetical protein
MSAFSIPFLRPSLKRSWQYAPGGVIWRLLVADSGSLVGEARSEAEKQVRFFCLDEQSGRSRWESLPVDEPWWTGVEAVHSDVVLIHGFAKPDLPEHHGLTAFDVGSGSKLWSAPECTYWFCHGDRLYTIRTVLDKRIGVVLDLHSGSVIEERTADLESWHPLRRSASVADAEHGMLFPEPFVRESMDPALCRCVDRALGHRKVEGLPEFVLVRDRLLFNVHERLHRTGESPAYRNLLFVSDVSRGMVLHASVVDARTRSVASDAFFVRGSQLFFIRDRVELQVFRLWKS